MSSTKYYSSYFEFVFTTNALNLVPNFFVLDVPLKLWINEIFNAKVIHLTPRFNAKLK